MNKKTFQEARHYFFLNPYQDRTFTRCPKCETKTKIRKFCLMIHIKPLHILSLNTTTNYCPYCSLIIVKKEKLEQLLCAICEQKFPKIIGNDYFVHGTMERKNWKKGLDKGSNMEDAINYMYPFKDIWSFKPVGGWQYDPNKDKTTHN